MEVGSLVWYMEARNRVEGFGLIVKGVIISELKNSKLKILHEEGFLEEIKEEDLHCPVTAAVNFLN